MYLWATKASNSFLIEITMLLIMLLGISIYSTNFELFSAVSVWRGGGVVHLVSLGGGGREILHLIQAMISINIQIESK